MVKAIKSLVIREELVMNKIYNIRGKKVMLDRDLAVLYNVEAKVLNRVVQFVTLETGRGKYSKYTNYQGIHPETELNSMRNICCENLHIQPRWGCPILHVFFHEFHSRLLKLKSFGLSGIPIKSPMGFNPVGVIRSFPFSP